MCAECFVVNIFVAHRLGRKSGTVPTRCCYRRLSSCGHEAFVVPKCHTRKLCSGRGLNKKKKTLQMDQTPTSSLRTSARRLSSPESQEVKVLHINSYCSCHLRQMRRRFTAVRSDVQVQRTQHEGDEELGEKSSYHVWWLHSRFAEKGWLLMTRN